MGVRQWPRQLRPREKAVSSGIESLSDSELIALILGSGIEGKSAVALAEEILINAGSLKNLMNMSVSELMRIKGIKQAKATQLAAGTELAKRVSRENVINSVISCPADVVNWLQKEIGSLNQETVYAVFLDVKNRILGYRCLFQGFNDRVFFNSRELLQQALKVSAVRIIIAHNHPSGNTEPSAADKQMTFQIREACRLMGIELVDHLILSHSSYYSFAENGT